MQEEKGCAKQKQNEAKAQDDGQNPSLVLPSLRVSDLVIALFSIRRIARVRAQFLLGLAVQGSAGQLPALSSRRGKSWLRPTFGPLGIGSAQPLIRIKLSRLTCLPARLKFSLAARILLKWKLRLTIGLMKRPASLLR